MKLASLFIISSFLFSFPTSGQTNHAKAESSRKSENQSVETIRQIFKDFIQFGDGMDSDDNKKAITRALKSLPDTINKVELPLLINVWMYYDPTDFDVRSIVMPIFVRNKMMTLDAIKYRLQHKKTWEEVDTAPNTDLIHLEKELRSMCLEK